MRPDASENRVCVYFKIMHIQELHEGNYAHHEWRDGHVVHALLVALRLPVQLYYALHILQELSKTVRNQHSAHLAEKLFAEPAHPLAVHVCFCCQVAHV